MAQSSRQTDLSASGFFAFRTPLLPFDALGSWADGLQAPAATDEPESLETALAADRARLRSRLAAWVTRPEVREALFVASPSLDDSFDLWLRDPDSERGQKVERSVVRYFMRLAGRPIPFGLFAGCSTGTLGGQTRLMVEGRERYRRHTRLDMD
jgi:hypothetical protein